MVRPSARTTRRVWLVQDTSTARASPFSTEVRMPLLQEELPVFKDDPPNFREFVVSKASYICQGYGFKPELGIPPGMSHVNVRRLATLHTEEEKPIPANPQQRWHVVSP